MILNLFVFDQMNTQIPVSMTEMTDTDAALTAQKPFWQTDWRSDFISDSRFLKYAMKAADQELIALASFECLDSMLVVHIVYAESSPESNPTMVKAKKYSGIGKAIIAYGIQMSVNCGFGGTVIFEAKTTALERHYYEDFKAVPLPSGWRNGAKRFMIDGEAAVDIISDYLI